MTLINKIRNFEPWRGIDSLMEGGWRRLPIKLDKELDLKKLSPKEETLLFDALNLDVRKKLKQYKFKISQVDKFAIMCDGMFTVRIKN